MNEIQIASAEFKNALPKANPPRPQDRSRLDVALDERVRTELLHQILNLMARPSFQGLVNWTFSRWLSDEPTSEKQKLSETINSLRELALSLRDFLRDNQDSLLPALGNFELSSTLTVEITADGIRESPQTIATTVSEPLLAIFLQELDWCLDSLTRPLISIEDFFAANYDRSIVLEDSRHTGVRVNIEPPRRMVFAAARPEQTPGLNPQIRKAGNMIVTCLLTRIDSIHRHLVDISRVINVALNKLNDRRRPWSQAMGSANRHCEDLRQLCLHTPEAKLADAATLLVRVAVDFSANERVLSWLPPEVQDSARAENTKQAMHYYRDLSFPQKVAVAMDRIGAWLESVPAEQKEIDDAIATHELVVIVATKEVYWQQQKVLKNWSVKRAAWEFMVAIAKTRGRTFLEQADLYYDEEVSDSTFRKRRFDWANGLPDSLSSAVEPVKGEGKYRLMLDSSQVVVFG